MLHMLQRLYTYVACVCSKCFICFFRHTLQVCLFECCIYFAMAFQAFLGVFRSVSDVSVSTFLNVCYKCFIWMLQKQIECCISLLAFCCLVSVSPPLLDAGDVRTTMARVGRAVWMVRVIRAA